MTVLSQGSLASSPSGAAVGDRVTGTRCQACHGDAVVVFFEVDDVPVHNSLLLDTRDEALAFPRGDLRLGHCPTCGFVQNTAFDATVLRYGAGYEDSQAHSPRFLSFATELARSLIDRYDLHQADIVEVGSGQGDFLDLLCRAGANRGIAYDPATDPADTPVGIEHRAEPFGPDTPVDALDLLVCRHTLEHVADASAFVAMLGGHLVRHPGAVGYLEVPDLLRVLREGAFWDLYYEHCSYFTRATLNALLARHGLEVRRSQLGFEGQYLQIEMVAGSTGTPIGDASTNDGASEVAEAVADFVQVLTELRDRWQASFAAWSATGRRVVLWGGGSKAVGFLTTLGLTDEVAAVVDINPRKQGRFLPGSGHAVIAPEALIGEPPDVVVVLNPVYVDEIRESLVAQDLTPEVLTT